MSEMSSHFVRDPLHVKPPKTRTFAMRRPSESSSRTQYETLWSTGRSDRKRLRKDHSPLKANSPSNSHYTNPILLQLEQNEQLRIKIHKLQQLMAEKDNFYALRLQEQEVECEKLLSSLLLADQKIKGLIRDRICHSWKEEYDNLAEHVAGYVENVNELIENYNRIRQDWIQMVRAGGEQERVVAEEIQSKSRKLQYEEDNERREEYYSATLKECSVKFEQAERLIEHLYQVTEDDKDTIKCLEQALERSTQQSIRKQSTIAELEKVVFKYQSDLKSSKDKLGEQSKGRSISKSPSFSKQQSDSHKNDHANNQLRKIKDKGKELENTVQHQKQLIAGLKKDLSQSRFQVHQLRQEQQGGRGKSESNQSHIIKVVPEKVEHRTTVIRTLSDEKFQEGRHKTNDGPSEQQSIIKKQITKLQQQVSYLKRLNAQVEEQSQKLTEKVHRLQKKCAKLTNESKQKQVSLKSLLRKLQENESKNQKAQLEIESLNSEIEILKSQAHLERSQLQRQVQKIRAAFELSERRNHEQDMRQSQAPKSHMEKTERSSIDWQARKSRLQVSRVYELGICSNLVKDQQSDPQLVYQEDPDSYETFHATHNWNRQKDKGARMSKSAINSHRSRNLQIDANQEIEDLQNQSPGIKFNFGGPESIDAHQINHSGEYGRCYQEGCHLCNHEGPQICMDAPRKKFNLQSFQQQKMVNQITQCLNFQKSHSGFFVKGGYCCSPKVGDIFNAARCSTSTKAKHNKKFLFS